ncbi:hypothetical protein N1030_07130 [Desulfovibrio mangrovi]|uniref:hypothetical protein n=1 Tax=Desulfovibrio mangrovi TaxID=2976983 RepID=UPI002245BFB1|nr:hypothetical protein [Desulfovibrio mangrovi]UZP68736.1 hypothetical protein N1030_07130 [Desulfovibrio mangrovi]
MWLAIGILLGGVLWAVYWAVRKVVLYVQWKMPSKPGQMVDPQILFGIRHPIPVGDMEVVLWDGEYDLGFVLFEEVVADTKGVFLAAAIREYDGRYLMVVDFILRAVVVRDVCKVYYRGSFQGLRGEEDIPVEFVEFTEAPDGDWFLASDYSKYVLRVDLDPYREMKAREDELRAYLAAQ